jgi:hypothetical protein
MDCLCYLLLLNLDQNVSTVWITLFNPPGYNNSLDMSLLARFRSVYAKLASYEVKVAGDDILARV